MNIRNVKTCRDSRTTKIGKQGRDNSKNSSVYNLHTDIYPYLVSLFFAVLLSLHLFTRSKKFSPKNKKDLGMAYHIPPLKK